MPNAMLEKWEREAWALGYDPGSPKIPLHVLLGEAVDIVRFFHTHDETRLDAKGQVVRPGLDQAFLDGPLHRNLGQEILELREATQAAQSAYLLTLSVRESPAGRASFVLKELRAALEFILAHSVEDGSDIRLERLVRAHPNPTSQDALAAALSDCAGLAGMRREQLDALGAFESGMIDEAIALAAELRAKSADRHAGTARDKQRRALSLRNRLAALLHRRMQLVRALARYVFRHDPKVVRRVTSSYQRQRNARYRRASIAGRRAGRPEPVLTAKLGDDERC